MAQVPLRMAQSGLIPPHQQRPPMMVSITQPPPASMQGLVTMAPMMTPGGGMAVMTQSINHPDTHDHHHLMNGPYGPPHPPPQHHPGPRPHPTQHHGPHHHAGSTQPSHAGPPPTQYHPHPMPQQTIGGLHNAPHAISHSGHAVSHISAAHCNVGTPAAHHGHVQTSSQPQHSVAHQQVATINNNMNSNQQHSLVTQGQPHQTYVAGPVIQSNVQMPLTGDKSATPGIIVLNANNKQNRLNITSNDTTNDLNEANSTHCTNYDGTTSNGADNMSVREKTPMCLINELARYNKIQHQYCLTDEKGPAHKKIFTVTLRIGESEEYMSSGASIKKAQHSAASIALKNTKFKHPPPKPPRQMQQPKLTPTVELNALAMKRGEGAVYNFIEAPRPPPNPYTFNITSNVRAMYNQKYYCRPPLYSVFFVSLKVGAHEFMGEGTTAQQAKHNAASKALRSIKTLPLPKNSCPSPAVADLSELDPNADLKSPISLVHEIALKRNFQVMFEVVRESGPPHMRTFITTCIVGDFRTQGEGTGKKASKKRAAEYMLEKLRSTLPPLPPNNLGLLKRKPTTKKKSRNLIKVGHEEQKAAPDYGQGINPISRLIQIQQAKKEKEPVYTLIAERGVPRRREFIMQVVVGNDTTAGTGQNKKLAKHAAAESMLQLLGYSRAPPLPVKSAIKIEGSHNDSDKTRKQVTFMEETSELPNNDGTQISVKSQPINMGAGRQLVPGLIIMQDGAAIHGYQQAHETSTVASPVNIQATAAIAKELLECGSSITAKSMASPQSSNSHPNVSPVTHPSTPQNTCPSHVQQQLSNRQNQPIAVNNPLQPLPSNKNPQQQYSHNQQPVQVQNVTDTVSSNNNNGSRNGLSISNSTSEQAVRPKEQLMYLANILNLQVQFTDFPKGNKGEYLSLVSLSTKPPHVSHGAGATLDASHDQACLTALRNMAEMGLDSVTSGTEENTSQ